MIEYSIEPLKGIGPILLGMGREESRRAMGIEPETFKKGKGARETDAYHESSFQIFFDDKDQVEYIELSENRSFAAIFMGKNVHSVEAMELVDFISKEVDSSTEDGFSFEFPYLELSLWRPVVSESGAGPEDRFFKTVGIGKRGYFSTL